MRYTVPTAVVFGGKLSVALGALTDNHTLRNIEILGDPDFNDRPAFRAYADQLREAFHEIQELDEVPYVIVADIVWDDEEDDWMDADLAHELSIAGVQLALVLPGDTKENS